VRAARRESKTGRSDASQSNLPVISLTTDFGFSDYFVGALKGIILADNPIARIVDITHDIPVQDIEVAAFTLLCCYSTFPKNTIHLAVVDPGVGSSRRPIVVRAADYYFVGPDNGVFSYIIDLQQKHQTIHVTAAEFFRQPVSSTFHGRDVFAPVAAALSLGTKLSALGQRIDDEVRLAPLSLVPDKKGRLKARILHIDRFGNCITNVTRKDLPSERESRVRLKIKGKTVKSFRAFYGEENKNRKEPFAIWGSAGFLEISITNASAASHLGVKRGDLVTVEQLSY
jgi:S-adenosylmethionine hydrolase